MPKARSVEPPTKPASYEAAMAELESLITKMESGELPLEASLSAYERGSVLIKYCQQVLEKIEEQVKVLDSDGHLKSLSMPNNTSE